MLIIRLGIGIELCIMMEGNGGDCDGRMGDRSGNGICWTSGIVVIVGFYIKSLKICRICCCAMTGYWL